LGTHGAIEYMVMERLYGIGLDEHLDQHRRAGETFRADDVMDLIRALAEGLRAIHSAGLAHQDVKPENVMLAPGGRIVLLDLGIGVPEVNAGLDGRIEGSPAYMAPEVISRNMRPGNAHLADLYALGVVAFEMLTGQTPFDGKTVWEIWAKHLNEPIPDVRRVRPDLPRALSDLVTELLSKDPGERPQSAESVLWYLDAMRSGRGSRPPVQLGPDVLVVDDDAAVLSGIAMLMREVSPGTRVRTATDGEMALAMVRQQVPDVLVTDLDMPRMNGMELCMHLRGMRVAERTAIIALSGTADVHDRQLLQALGINRFVAKEPGAIEEVPGILRALLAERR
jgi:serine/threonine-protein kinase